MSSLTFLKVAYSMVDGFSVLHSQLHFISALHGVMAINDMIRAFHFNGSWRVNHLSQKCGRYFVLRVPFFHYCILFIPFPESRLDFFSVIARSLSE
jgi:hypothetical protein